AGAVILDQRETAGADHRAGSVRESEVRISGNLPTPSRSARRRLARPVDRSAGSFIANRTGGRTIHEVGAAGGRFRASRLRQITRTQTGLLDLGVVDLVEVLGEAAELGKGLLLDLSNALARDGELSPHLFESMVAARPDAEAHA